MNLQNGRMTMSRGEAFLDAKHAKKLSELGIELFQSEQDSRKYFIGESVIDLEVSEGIDWFDIKAVIKFGANEISFEELRNLISLKKKSFSCLMEK